MPLVAKEENRKTGEITWKKMPVGQYEYKGDLSTGKNPYWISIESNPIGGIVSFCEEGKPPEKKYVLKDDDIAEGLGAKNKAEDNIWLTLFGMNAKNWNSLEL